jgi:hypothetical protein
MKTCNSLFCPSYKHVKWIFTNTDKGGHGDVSGRSILCSSAGVFSSLRGHDEEKDKASEAIVENELKRPGSFLVGSLRSRGKGEDKQKDI